LQKIHGPYQYDFNNNRYEANILQAKRNIIVVVVSNLGGVASAVYLAQAGREVTLQNTLLGGFLT
jgi:hypothetical protein